MDRVEEAARGAQTAADAAVGVNIGHATGEALKLPEPVNREHDPRPLEGLEVARVACQGLAVTGM